MIGYDDECNDEVDVANPYDAEADVKMRKDGKKRYFTKEEDRKLWNYTKANKKEHLLKELKLWRDL
jgi:hypothetical protein